MAAKLYELCNYWKNWLYSKQPARHSQNLPMKWKNRSNIFIGLTITVFCVWLAFRKVPFTELSDVISGGNYYWIIPAAVTQLLAILVRSQRWVVLLDRNNALTDSIWSQGIGYCLPICFLFVWVKWPESW